MSVDYRGGPRPSLSGPRPARVGRASSDAGFVSSQVKEIRGHKRMVMKRIREIKRDLIRFKGIPNATPYISFRKATSIKDLMGNSSTFLGSLRKDIKKLRAMLKSLDKDETVAVRRTPERAGKNFADRLEDALRKAEKTGSLDPEVLAGLQAEAEEVVALWGELLVAYPTDKNLESTLDALGNAMLLGAESLDKGLKSLVTASGAMGGRAREQFRRVPSSENMAKILSKAALTGLFGGEEDLFQGRIGSGPSTFHVITGNETLSGLAEQYYGDMSQWDLIYLTNLAVAGANPDRVPRGVELEIPPLAGSAAR